MILTVAAEVLVYIRVTERREIKWIIPTVLFILAYALFTILIYRLAIQTLIRNTKIVVLVMKFLTSKSLIGIMMMYSLAELMPSHSGFFRQSAASLELAFTLSLIPWAGLLIYHK
jgi:hypothetical protein